MLYFVSLVINPTGSPSYYTNTVVEAKDSQSARDAAAAKLYPAKPSAACPLSIVELTNIPERFGAGFSFTHGSEVVYLAPVTPDMLIGTGYVKTVILPDALDWQTVLDELTEYLRACTQADQVVILTIDAITT